MNSKLINIIQNKYFLNIGSTFEEAGDVIKLGDGVFAVAAVFNQQWKHVIELCACVRRVEFGQLAEDGSPRFDLLLGVFHPWYGLTTVMAKCYKDIQLECIGLTK